MSDKPLLSIITVTYNASREVGVTLRSVHEQTCRDFEFVVQDGASKDDTVEQVQGADIPSTRIESRPDKGLYDAMNRAMSRARGEYLIFLNAGDTFACSDSLQTIADKIRETDADIVYGQTQIVDEQRKVIGMRHLSAPRELTFNSFKRGMLVCHQAFVVRHSIAGDYDLTYRFSADYEWCLRCLKASRKNAYCDAVLISFLDGGTTTKYHRASLRERFRIMCRYYGTASTLLRHLSFIPRALWRKLNR